MKHCRTVCGIICAILAQLSLSSCLLPWEWRYTSEKGVFKTQDGSLVIDCGYRNGLLLVDGEYLELDFGVHPTLLHLDFNNHIPYNGKEHGITEDMILLYVDVEADEKTKTLTLTVTGGTLEQFLGNVYVLDFYPDEKLKFDDAVTTGEMGSDSGTTEG